MTDNEVNTNSYIPHNHGTGIVGKTWETMLQIGFLCMLYNNHNYSSGAGVGYTMT